MKIDINKDLLYRLIIESRDSVIKERFGGVLSKKEIEEGLFFKFNEKVILRTDSKTQIEALSKAVNNGIYTPNEAREYLDKPSKEGGDKLVMNGNYIPITDVGKQYAKGGDKNE